MSGLFDDPTPPRRTAPPPRPQRSRALGITAVVLVVGFFVLSAFTGLWTDRLWFNSVGFGDVFTTVLTTRVLLFIGFGLVMGGFVAANVVLAFRHRPPFRAMPSEANLERYREVVEPLRAWVVIAVAGLLALVAGGSAAGQWRSFLLWRNGGDFGAEDPYFDRDIGFFVFDLPWLHYVVNFAMMTVVLGLVAAIVVHYLFGGIALQSRTDKVSGAAQVQFSVLLGLFVLFKAVDYWLDRFDLTTDQGRRFTGVNYTAFNAILPSKNILMFIALICALLFFANVFRRTWLLPGAGLGLLVLSAVLLGAVWPGIVWQFQVKPSEPDKEERFLAANIEATRAAYNIDDVAEQQYDATVSVTKDQLRKSADSLPGIRLIDPARTSAAFEQLQQVRGYYSVAPVLDVDRYEINGETRDLVMGVRELDQDGLVDDQRNWANEHTVYTHGYGLVAAFGNNRTADGGTPSNPDEPPWAEEDLPPRGELSDLTDQGYEPRIYFGEKSPEYSVVGKAEDGDPDVELDIPEEASGERGNTTFDTEKGTGVPVGGFVNKVLYALKFGEPNFLLSNRVNSGSQVLYERTPRERVEKVAPWLTVDGDPYPAVVDGRVQWILDGYTTTDRFPNAERESFQEMTSDALTSSTSYVTLPTDQINYIRNSVKATVDAYTGEVVLYEWEEDPILDAWKAVFPDAVTPRENISDELAAHLRYPEDMFKTQRYMLAQYHVTAAQEFYRGTDRWQVPEDPAETVKMQPPYRLSVQMPPAPATEEDATSEDATDTADLPVEDPVFSLTSVFTPTNRQNLASFVAVNSDARDENYGQFRILRLPDTTQVQGPSQIANTFSADANIQDALLPIKQNSQILDGNLLTLPVGGGLLYVQPVYALQETGEGSYPVLQFVLASFGRNAGFGTTLTEALNDVLESGELTEEDTGGNDEDGSDTGGGTDTGDGGGEDSGGTGTLSPEVLDLLQQAVDTFAEADQALTDGDTVRYAELTEQAEELVKQAQAASEEE
ncbi:UPF0182 family protein [Nocardioides sp. HDW12B]|uniref:UPF0182 family membrane protein n=1 Tax=Nocardioides sp. HDW12B TaxID=2714939 RepID=UPI00140B9401|nr:UPF0182 family protein [Nocardioides sp. HDW12B]QIK67389.1 UPF0182 family protein [Nocardioides sp. HDW12B]